MKRFAYLLIIVSLWAQVGDARAITPVSPSATLTDEVNDEYLPSQRRSEQEEASSARREWVFVRRVPTTPDSPLVRRGVLLAWGPIAPRTAPPLYLFMSLQI